MAAGIASKAIIVLLLIASARSQKNVLFIAVDDLRPQLSAYGYNYITSPSIDAFAAKSIVFERAYCQVAVCSPSRAALLTGRRPDTNRVWSISDDQYWRIVPGGTNATTIPQYFKEKGYISLGMGKIFHDGAPGGNDDYLYSWSPEGLPYYNADNDVIAMRRSWASLDFPAYNFSDGKIADRAINTLQQLKQNKSNGDTRPFFLAVGFYRPHLPFYAPTEYYDLYPPSEQIPLPDNPDAPTGMPDIAWSTKGELRGYRDIDDSTQTCRSDPEESIRGNSCRIPDDTTRDLRRGYYACVSFIDAQIGRVLSELESQGFADDTIVVVWGDHGYHLGEHNLWCKSTNFEDAARVPLIMRVPGVTDGGMRTTALVELIDLFPSLTELAGIDVPPLCTKDSPRSIACVEGTSVAPLLVDPDRQWKNGAFSQFPRPNSGLRQITGRPGFVQGDTLNVMGYSIRVDKYRFTEWYGFDSTSGLPNFTDIWGTELYNHSSVNYFFNGENVNMATDPDMMSMVNELRVMLQKGWRGSMPPSSLSSAVSPYPLLLSVMVMLITTVFLLH
jgi:arylsulfatase A-like enzyme